MNDFYILLAQFFSTCLLQYFYICLGKIKQINLKSATPFPKCYLHKEKWTFDS